MDLTEYQTLAQQTDRTRRGSEEEARLIPLLGLAGEAGQLLSEYKKRLRDGPSHERFVDRVSEELGDILWYVANVATKYGLSLNAVARDNLVKTRERFLPAASAPDLDASFGETERFPRKLIVDFQEVRSDGRVEVRMTMDGVLVGAALTDNAYQDDGYRFHDVFHIANAAVLGWSPVLRALIKRKRRSDPKTDEVEDGGRAAVIEEGVVAAVFDYARQHAFLKGVTQVDEALLRTLRGMCGHLEVAGQSPAAWCKAIIDGFSVWREVVANSGGRVEADLDAQTVRYVAPPSETPIATAAAAVAE
jgi:NTP pyrophosphatase (non-canonical NTP hydrolase)